MKSHKRLSVLVGVMEKKLFKSDSPSLSSLEEIALRLKEL